MRKWTVALRPSASVGGLVSRYSGTGVDGMIASAEALAHFSSLAQRPEITLESRLEVTFDNATLPQEIVDVRAVLRYVRQQPEILASLNEEDLRILERLADSLGA